MNKIISRIIQRAKSEVYSHRYKRDKQFVVQTEYMDCKILVRANEDVGLHILIGNFETTDIKYLLSKTKDGDVFFDIGANVGLFSLAVAKKNQTINVHSFEPIPLNASLFEASLYLNGIESVRINRTCIGNRQGEVDFSLADDSAYSSIHDTGRKTEIKKICVPITTLDEYIADVRLKRVDIIKIDVEGAENQVLEGAHSIFSNQSIRPRIVLMELFDKNFVFFDTSIKSIVEKMRNYGYSPFVLYKGRKIEFQEQHHNIIYNVFFECENLCD